MAEQDPGLAEALRYMGIRGELSPELFSRASAMMRLARTAAQPRFTYILRDLERTAEGYRLSGTGVILTGASAERMLSSCRKAALMICTLGLPFENACRAMQKRDMASGMMLDACGSALVEEVCDRVQAEIAAKAAPLFATDRFSPGYGDLPLSLQSGIFAALDAEKRTGVHLNASCLMTPQKSVTAVIGFSDAPQPAKIRGCACCMMKETCTLRRGGKRCDSFPE